MRDVLAGAAAGLQHFTGLALQEWLQHRPDRRMVAMERRRVEPAIGLNPPAVGSEALKNTTIMRERAVERAAEGNPIEKAKLGEDQLRGVLLGFVAQLRGKVIGSLKVGTALDPQQKLDFRKAIKVLCGLEEAPAARAAPTPAACTASLRGRVMLRVITTARTAE